MKTKKLIELIEIVSRHYIDERPTMGQNNRVILERRWQVIRVLARGIYSGNYQKALKLVEGLMDKNPDKTSRDGILLDELVTLIEKYEKRFDFNATPIEEDELEEPLVLDELNRDHRTAINILNRNVDKLIKRIKKLESK